MDWIWATGGTGFVCWVRVGKVVEEGSVANNRVALSELSSRYPGALIVMEAGCHSPWVSRHLEQAGCEVIVSNPRKTRAIYQHERKSDRRDVLMLARIAWMEPALLYPVRHGSEEGQQDLLRIKLRDSLVRARVGLINSLRFTLKSLGYTIANPSTERFHKVIESALPESVVQMIAPSVQAIEELSLRIKLLDREIRILGSHQVSRDKLAGADPRSRSDHCALFRFEDWRSGAL